MRPPRQPYFASNSLCVQPASASRVAASFLIPWAGLLQRLIIERVQEPELHRHRGVMTAYAQHHPKPERPAAAAVAIREWMQRLVEAMNHPRMIDAGGLIRADDDLLKFDDDISSAGGRYMISDTDIEAGAVAKDCIRLAGRNKRDKIIKPQFFERDEMRGRRDFPVSRGAVDAFDMVRLANEQFDEPHALPRLGVRGGQDSHPRTFSTIAA